MFLFWKMSMPAALALLWNGLTGRKMRPAGQCRCHSMTLPSNNIARFAAEDDSDFY